MEITGIICEYNPFHLGHSKQISMIRQKNPNCAIVCLMSGNYVQRGMPAIFDKEIRAKAALSAGADLVLELPVTAALSSAEGFAAEGIRILGSFCDHLSFGAETPDADEILKIANILLSNDFSIYLKKHLSDGLSFPAARQKALEEMGHQSNLLQTPNNILAVEYAKAIISQNIAMKPQPILREGNFHACTADYENPSATSVRLLLENNKDFCNFVPQSALQYYTSASIHTISSAEKAILYRLRTMTDEEFENLPYGSEGLWRKLMKNARQHATLDDIITTTKSKRYTRTRLDRMIMCAFLGLTQADIQAQAPYCRVLALNDTGREVLLKARQSGNFPNLGEKMDHPYQELEIRCDNLYGLFAVNEPEKPVQTSKRHIFYKN